MKKPLLTVKLRALIEEYSALLEGYGFPTEAEYFRLAMANIPLSSDKRNYLLELSKLVGLRRDCYNIPVTKPVAVETFLVLQASNTTPQ